MIAWLDRFLNKITMYKLVFYVLLAWLGLATVFGFIGKMPFNGWEILLSTGFLVTICWWVNRVFAWAFNVTAHDDSAFITGLILSLIITPYRHLADLPLFIWAPILAMAAKYILALRRQHLFNPAAMAVVITGLAIQQAASWWVGTAIMFWPVLIGGLLVVRKIRRFDVVTSYLVVMTVTTILYGVMRGSAYQAILRQLFLNSPVLFFAAIMLTEPATMPSTHRMRLLFGGVVGLMSAPFIHLGSFYFTPELALVAGNLMGWAVDRRERFVLTLRERIQIAPTISDFVFEGPRLPKFQAGQYLEWSLPHEPTDSRGSRRYFTVASSPTESELRLGVKFYQPSSTYKQSLLGLEPGHKIIAQQLDGDFVLPKDAQQPLVFIAGGIGITPFRSMLKYLLDRQQVRPITVFYANQVINDIVYTDILDQAESKLGTKVVYLLSDVKNIPPTWQGQRGFVTAEMIQREVPNYGAARFYLSGPQGMVTAYEKVLRALKVPKSNIVTDYFPGFA